MTREQVINLRVGQRVQISHFADRYLAIRAIHVGRGVRIFELETGIFCNASEIKDVLPPRQAA